VLPSAENISDYGALRRRRIVEVAAEEWSVHRRRSSDDHAAFDERLVLPSQKWLVRNNVCFDVLFFEASHLLVNDAPGNDLAAVVTLGSSERGF
jgi:hypothetical protein